MRTEALHRNPKTTTREDALAAIRQAQDALARAEALLMQTDHAPEARAPGLWDRFDPYRAEEYLEPLWAAWGPGHPSLGHQVARSLAERLQRWLGELSPEKRRDRAEALVEWIKGSYTVNKVRLLLDSDWDDAVAQKPRTQEARKERYAELRSKLSELETDWALAGDEQRAKLGAVMDEIRKEMRGLKAG